MKKEKKEDLSTRFSKNVQKFADKINESSNKRKIKGGKLYKKFEDFVNKYYKKIEKGSIKLNDKIENFEIDTNKIKNCINKLLSKIHLDRIINKLKEKFNVILNQDNDLYPLLILLSIMFGILIIVGIAVTILK